MRTAKLLLPSLLIALAVSACSGQNSAPAADIVTPAQPAEAATTAAEAAALQVVTWGPDKITAGQAFNQQPDGSSGLWFELSGPIHGQEVTATLDGKPLLGVVVSDKVITAIVPADQIPGKGEHAVEIQLPNLGTTIQAGTLVAE